MKKYEIILLLNADEKIRIKFEESTEKWLPDDKIPINFININTNIILDERFIDEALSTFCIKLNKALRYELKFHDSINKDIGFLWNEELQNKPGLSYSKLEGNDYWVGLYNLLWETPGYCKPKLSTWIYNDSDGEIILEITPSYPWHFTDPEELDDKDYVPYEEWIKTYKPLLIRKISKEIALRWKEQVEEILSILEKNSQYPNSSDVTFITNSKYLEYSRRRPFYSPDNGQEALDNSVVYSPNSNNRVGISEGNFVVLDCDNDNPNPTQRRYHGHLRAWDSLEQDMKNALINANLVDQRGNIL